MKRYLLPVLLLFSVLMCSCTGISERAGEFFLKRSGITGDEDYIQYEKYRDAGALDEEGYYADTDIFETEPEPELPHPGSVHVTFADNRYLTINYYYDSERTQPIDKKLCYMNPGETVYASEPFSTNTSSNLYALSEYRIYEYDSEGKKKTLLSTQPASGITVYQLPVNFTGTELEIMPIGEYPDRVLSMSAYYVEHDGTEHVLNSAGKWYVNDTECARNTASISAIESYALRFDYDEANYFYVTADPKPFTQDPQKVGFVEFWTADPNSGEINYSVELKGYLSLQLRMNEDCTISLNGWMPEELKKGKQKTIDHLKYGDEVIIETNGGVEILDGDYHYVRAERDPILEGYRYTLRIVGTPSDNAAAELANLVQVTRTFDVTIDPSAKYGEAVFQMNGQEVRGDLSLREDQELLLIYTLTDDSVEFTEKSDGLIGFIHDLFNKKERIVTIPVTPELDGTTLRPDDFVSVEVKGE